MYIYTFICIYIYTLKLYSVVKWTQFVLVWTLHGLGAVAGGDETLLFSHQSLKRNPFEETKQINLICWCWFKKTIWQEHKFIYESVIAKWADEITALMTLSEKAVRQYSFWISLWCSEVPYNVIIGLRYWHLHKKGIKPTEMCNLSHSCSYIKWIHSCLLLCLQHFLWSFFYKFHLRGGFCFLILKILKLLLSRNVRNFPV